MPQFVVLTHDHPFLHWDLMLEAPEGLRTWRLARPPTQEPGEIPGIPAESLPLHRHAYLDYEGPVSGNRGTVTRWDRGEYTVVGETPDRLEVVLTGKRLQGRAVLQRSSPSETWTFLS